MNLEINGLSFPVPPEYQAKFIEQAYRVFLLAEYEKQDKKLRLGLKTLARGLLMKMEQGAKTREIKDLMRPPKGTDATLHLAKILMGVINEGLNYATLSIEINESTACVASFSLSIPNQSAGGGQMANSRNDGLRQDDLRQKSLPAAGETVSNRADIHP